jgi:hypothetical protein
VDIPKELPGGHTWRIHLEETLEEAFEDTPWQQRFEWCPLKGVLQGAYPIGVLREVPEEGCPREVSLGCSSVDVLRRASSRNVLRSDIR